MFTHLHNHTEFSLFDGVSRIPDMVKAVKDQGMDAVAITDHGNMYGVITFYEECKEQGIKPIIGCELYAAKQNRLDHSPVESNPQHLVVLAQDNVGYHNLIKLVTTANIDGFYHKPRVDLDLLSQHAKGLICLSGCMSAAIPELIADNNLRGATHLASQYHDIFGDNYFLELQRHQAVPFLDEVNQALVKMSDDLKIPTVVTNDAHYTLPEHYQVQDLYICIQTKDNVKNPNRFQMKDHSYYIKSPAEMSELFSDHPQAVARAYEIGQQCNVTLDFNQSHIPGYRTPDGQDPDDYLADLCKANFYSRYGNDNHVANLRMRYELEVIRQTNFANYFLVVHDIITFVRSQGIRVAVRGSAAASIVLYCTDVTDIDPLKYDLVFERFLNPERKEMPDIDLDFQDDRRDEVMNYVIEKYGQNNVAHIISFNSMGARAAIRDAGRALAMPYPAVDLIAKMIPAKVRTIDDALEKKGELTKAVKADTQNKLLIDQARELEGLVRNVNTHAAGILIADDRLDNVVPLQRPSRTDSPVLMTQYSMDQVAKLGLLKMDFLGLTSLTILDQTEKLVPDLDLDNIPLDDPAVYQMLSSGRTTNVFQLESNGMQRYINELQPSNIMDISAMIALYRPGPMEQIDRFIRSKHGQTQITYPHPSFKDILDETYGVIVYQDQVLKILQQFAGYTMGAADIVRKAMGKKDPELMVKQKQGFIDGVVEQGYSQPEGNEIWDLIEPFAGYAFNKAHSVSYALISYRTAYCKTHHPTEYMTAVLNCRMDSTDLWEQALHECRRLQIEHLLPSINHSDVYCTPADNAVRLGLAAIRNIGESSVRGIVNHAPYNSIDDFCRRAPIENLNRRTFENLIRAGAFDELASRGTMVASMERILNAAHKDKQRRASGQNVLFDSLDNADASMLLTNMPDLNDDEKASNEKELLGINVTPGSTYAPDPAETPDPFAPQPPPKLPGTQPKLTPGPNTVIVDIIETGDAEADIHHLHQTLNILLAHPGTDPVVLNLTTLQGQQIKMVVESVTSRNSTALQQTISEHMQEQPTD